MKKKSYRFSILIMAVIFSLTIINFSSVVYADTNKTALQTMVEINIPKLDMENQFTLYTYPAFKTAMTVANTVLSNNNATQQDVDNARTALEAAINALVRQAPTNYGQVTKDTFIYKDTDPSHGSETSVQIKFPVTDTTVSDLRRRGLVGFDISNIAGNEDRIVVSLYMTQMGSQGTGATTAYLHVSPDNWTENITKWSQIPTADPNALATYTDAFLSDKAKYVDFDVTDYVKAQKNLGVKNISFQFGTSSGENGVANGSSNCAFNSRESSTPPLLSASTGPQPASRLPLGTQMEADLNSFNINDYVTDTMRDKITGDLKPLPSKGPNGYTITWTSSNPEVLHNDGKVTAIDKDVAVTLTAAINSDGVTHTRSFPFTIARGIDTYTDEELVDLDLAYLAPSLTFASLTSQDPNFVSNSIILPVFEEGYCAMAWAVDNPKNAKIENNILSFILDNSDTAKVTLKFVVSRGNCSKSVDFPMTLIRGFADNLAWGNVAIKASSGTPEPAMTRDMSTYWESDETDQTPYLQYDFATDTKINSALLVEKGNGIQKFKVSASEDAVVWNSVYDGTVLGDANRNAFTFDPVTCKHVRVDFLQKTTPTISIRTFEVYNAAITDQQVVDEVLKSTVLPKTVKDNISLPLTGDYGTKISWSTSNSNAISATGNVTRAKNVDVSLELTETVTYNGVSGSKTFPITVIRTIEYTGGSHGGGGGGGSTFVPYIPQTNIVAPEPNVMVKAASFQDVSETHWAYSYIKTLADSNVIQGNNNLFRPDDSITREEFLKMLLTSGKMELTNEGASFKDVSTNEWYYPYVATANNLGIVKGISDDEFGIGLPITRQDMAVIVSRLLEKKNALSQNAAATNYKDQNEISDYAVEATVNMAVLQIMNGNEQGDFMPKANTARAEAAKIIYVLQGILAK